jgi:hypothetical protein
MLLTLLLLASLPTFPQTADSSQPEGTISGTVLDEPGDPFKGVTVCTYMIGAPSGSKEARGDCPVTTDQAGEFRIDHMAMGTFGVEAIKPEDGYIAFAGTSVIKMVTLTPSQLSATVALKLGPKPGVLLPSVKDKLTGEPIISFQVSWEISDGPKGSHSGGETIGPGIKRAIVPPEKYFRLTISAPGYKKWIYHDPSDPSRPALIRFQAGEEKELLVELEPQESTPAQPQGRIIGALWSTTPTSLSAALVYVRQSCGHNQQTLLAAARKPTIKVISILPFLYRSTGFPLKIHNLDTRDLIGRWRRVFV